MRASFRTLFSTIREYPVHVLPHTAIFLRKIANVSLGCSLRMKSGPRFVIEVLISPPQIKLRGALFAMLPKGNGIFFDREVYTNRLDWRPARVPNKPQSKTMVIWFGNARDVKYSSIRPRIAGKHC